MVENITVAVLVIIILAAGIWSWWFTNQGEDASTSTKEDKSND